MLKQFALFLFLLLFSVTLYAQDSVRVNLKIYPEDLTVKIDDILLQKSGKERSLSLAPGNYTLSAESGDSVLTERGIAIHEKDLYNTIQYRINGRKSQRKFRMQLAGQWMFNEYEEEPFYIFGKKSNGEEVITTPYYVKHSTYGALDLGFVNKNDFYFGIYSELLNIGGMFSFGIEVPLHPAVNLFVGGKGGFMMEYYNSYYTQYLCEGETLWDYPNKWSTNGYEFNGWINGNVLDSSKFVVEALNEHGFTRFASLDAQVSLGRRAIKFFLRTSLWLGRITDYESYKYVVYDTYSYDTTYAVEFDKKLVPLPSLSAGVQFNIEKRRKIGIHGPFGSNREQSSTSHKNDVLGGTKLSEMGSRWFGGSFKISNERESVPDFDYPNNGYKYRTALYRTMALSTITRFFPRDNFILGPSFNWLLYVDRSDYSVKRDQLFLIGADIGYCKNIRKKIIHYGLANPQFGLGISTGRNWHDGRSVYPDFLLTVKFGTIYMLNKNLGLQIEPSFPIIPFMSEGMTWDLFVGLTLSLDRNTYSIGTSIIDRMNFPRRYND